MDKRGWIDRFLKPDYFCPDLQGLDFGAWAQLGLRVVFVDLDNTLCRHGAVKPDEYAVRQLRRIRSAGLLPVLYSNGLSGRVSRIAAALGADFVAQAGKPAVGSLRRMLGRLGALPSQAAVIGDQFLTDILAAKRSGCLAVLVRPRFRQEAWNVRLKRLLERLLYRRYGFGTE